MSETPTPDTGPRRVVVVTGLSGAGKASILHALEDAGYDAVDNPPLGLVADLASRADRDIAIGVDARTPRLRRRARAGDTDQPAPQPSFAPRACLRLG